MENSAILSYVHIKRGILNTDINLDSDYIFSLRTVQKAYFDKHTLSIKKRQSRIPDHFFGSNISTFNMIVGKNGAGKTSVLRTICENISRGLTAMNGEKILYIVKHDKKYIIFSNLGNLSSIERTADCEGIIIEKEEDFFDTLRGTREANFFDHRVFWRNMVWTSNFFGNEIMGRENAFVIDVSKDRRVYDLIEEKGKAIIQKPYQLQKLLLQKQWLKCLEYMEQSDFKTIMSEHGTLLPELISFKIRYSDDIQKFTDPINPIISNQFPNKQWIPKKRYSLFLTDSGFLLNEGEFYFECALNRFSVQLMYRLFSENHITENLYISFFDYLSNTEDKTGIIIAYQILKTIEDEHCSQWCKLLKFLMCETRKRILYWQSDDIFVYKWDLKSEEDRVIIRSIFESDIYSDILSCKLEADGKNGQYSSGERTKLNNILSFYEARKRIEKTDNTSRNVLLLIDEIDAFYHPAYQIEAVNNILQLVCTCFGDYTVQIIMTSNTPLELTDVPHSQIVYLKEGKSETEYENIPTFGGNVSYLMKNTFFLNSLMGDFAKSKIDSVIHLLRNPHAEDAVLSLDEAEYIISIIADPIIRNKLEKWFFKCFPERHPDENSRIAEYEHIIRDLKNRIVLSRRIPSDELMKLKDNLEQLSETVDAVLNTEE